ncbi:hypothetical protein WRPBWLFC_CDS0027 [Escherichia phage SM_S22]
MIEESPERGLFAGCAFEMVYRHVLEAKRISRP